MKINIDIGASIERSRLVYKFRTWHELFDQILFFVYSICFIAIGAMMVIYIPKTSTQVPAGLVLLLVGILFLSIVSLYTLLSFDKLIRFQGFTPELNSKIMREVISKRYGTSPAPSVEMLKLYRRPSLWKNGKRLIVLFSGNDILINLGTFNYRNIRSPFHGVFDHYAIYIMKKQFRMLAFNQAN